MAQWIDDSTIAESAVRSLGAAPVLAFDSEGDGFFRYRSQLCVVQLQGGDACCLFDTLQGEVRETLRHILSSHGPEKIVHDAAYDARLLHDWDLPFGRVFDTAQAARFLGKEATGLGSLVKVYFDVVLPKDKQQSDWGRRPLPEEELAYLERDVTYLVPLAERLRDEIAEQGIEEELRLETEYTLAQATKPVPPPKPPWTRIKGHDKMGARQKGVLREVADLREKIAKEWDVPPFRVTHNSTLLMIAQRSPARRRDLTRIRGMSRRLLGRADEILDAVQRGNAEPQGRPKEGKPNTRNHRQHKARQKTLNAWRREEAEARKVDVQVVLPGHCVHDIADLERIELDALRRIEGLGDLRIERYGKKLIELLS